MSVLPFVPVGDVSTYRSAEPSTRPGTDGAKVETGVVVGGAALVDADAVAHRDDATLFPRELQRKTDPRFASYQRIEDPRQFTRHMYRSARLRTRIVGSDSAWEQEQLPLVDALLDSVTRGDARTLGEHEARDPFQRYLLLLEASERLSNRQASNLNDALAERLEQALNHNWDQHGAAILAGFNTMPALAEDAKNAGEWNYYREIYTELVLNDGTLAATYKALLGRVKASGMALAILKLRNAIAADLGSPFVSGNVTQLHQYYRDLEGNRTINSLMSDSDALCRRIQGESTGADEVMGFIDAVLDFAGSSPNATVGAEQRFNSLCALLRPRPGVRATYIREQVRAFLKTNVPTSLWHSHVTRDSLYPSNFRTRP
jgi:hypothetical protein